MRRIKLAIVATCAAVAAATITPAHAAEEQSYLAALSTAIEKDGLVETISSELVGLSLFPLGVILLLSSKPGMI
ncbi:hypothetical protein [uncultured Corynebacterium sp.]|uniref:hypothetical protein n=1 Tax=uncultured Corynebacterium sp. TaxID=159447 RepID=UPI0028E99BF3|nr:hypothetical protein [uncultured Corynebacterium sp.]